MHLSPKAFDLLTTLVENRSGPMTRADLHKRLWPDTFVQDTTLASLVAEVRRALSDVADDPKFIRTVQRFGYWFVGTIKEDPARLTPEPGRFWLVWDTGQTALIDGRNVIGRAPDATVWIDATGVSRAHALITVAGHEATLEDLGSKNGTFVRGEPVVAPVPLANGDQIRLGSVVVTFRVPLAVDTTDTLSS